MLIIIHPYLTATSLYSLKNPEGGVISIIHKWPKKQVCDVGQVMTTLKCLLLNV